MDPLPSSDDLMPYYETDFFSKTKASAYLDNASDEEKNWRDGLYGDRLRLAEKYLNTNGKELLDIGCGPGRFLRVAQNSGWTIKGIEPGVAAVEYCHQQGFDVDAGFFDTVSAATLGEFDIVHSDMVLEHVPHPANFVQLVKKTLKRDGIFIISVPNDFNPFQMTLESSGNFQPWWIDRDHINYFNFDTLENLLSQNGFEVLDRLTTFPMDMFLLMGENYIDDNQLGPLCHKKRMHFDLNFEYIGLQEHRLNFYRQLAQAGMGRHAIIIAKVEQHEYS
ncbi:class I SAM-dependent methyltransferase [Neptuniibacter sp.]|uniref:class I SAM-dependent methyltransferase n=1 Tax=Neptuniibacter sp. TaxID=1962643 RepID=UPI00260848FC|nr:class I SAM-dependent methyltransferase [Neptuniibacter sp.]MCP4595905.1 class I SAM-dependent methyltransferase [Neptuniibacter sp.]